MSSSMSYSAGGGQVVSQMSSEQINFIQTFSRAFPVPLGVVQIMTGVTVLLFGIPMVTVQPILFLVVYSGVFAWGAALYITAGTFTLLAGQHFHLQLVKHARSFCISSAIVSFIAAVLQSVDASRISGSFVSGFLGVLAVFHFLQCAVSITVTVFASLAIGDCTCNNQVPAIFAMTGNQSMSAQAPPPSSVRPPNTDGFPENPANSV